MRHHLGPELGASVMKLSFFTMPVHPPGKPVAQSLREDREAFLLADRLGFAEAYCGEHTTDQAEIVTSTVAFLASLAYETKTIRLGTGTVNLPNSHPARVAAEVAMLDHMLEGRLNFGISPGGLLSDAEIFGNLDGDRNAMFVEAIDTVLKLWQGEPPYDIEGNFWNVTTRRTMLPAIGQGIVMKPFQRPHPPIIGTAVAPHSKGVAELAARGWDPLSANFLLPQWVATHWTKYVEGCRRAGRSADGANWRVARSIFVADDRETARRYARDPDSPYMFYFSQLLTKMKRGGRSNLFKEDPGMPDEALTIDYVADRLITHGTADEVVDKLLALDGVFGPSRHIVYAGHDWKDPALARRSMVLMAEKVLPALERQLGSAERPRLVT